MSHLRGLRFQVIIGPVVVAAFAGFELRHEGTFAAVAGGFCVFATCVFAVGLWGEARLERARRRVDSLRNRRSRRAR